MLQFSQIQERLFSAAIIEVEKRQVKGIWWFYHNDIETENLFFQLVFRYSLNRILRLYCRVSKPSCVPSVLLIRLDCIQLFIWLGLILVSNLLSFYSQSWKNFVQTFLFMLSSHSDPNLQGLGVRLDFNECYQRKDSRLSMSLTFSYRRMTLWSAPSQHAHK